MNRFATIGRGLLLSGLAAVSGCYDGTRPHEGRAPAPPRGLYSVTGDHEVTLEWLPNTESDVVLYRVYEAPCAEGRNCPYRHAGSTPGTSFTVSGLSNGATRYFAVAAVDRAGNESEFSEEIVFDTPRPEGFGAVLEDASDDPAHAGWDFSAQAVRPDDDASTDVFYRDDGRARLMIAPHTDTDIQDAGQASSLDAVDFAPATGWSPTGTVELVVGHCYVVRTYDDHYAKFRVRELTEARLVFDWAYQVDRGNRELSQRPSEGRPRARRVL